ncbi:ATP synthase F0 subunit C [Candidatus Gottesmanbacteria bacterium RIFCSPLOWO2_01_FULL_46_9]|uniref:ATP synthase subunit c n=1 Tax=Candidatus Gottesmanbacteria bacterium RIFCSPLOWO2_01_FULL_46_9 TaxID=1798394 RepID=A0A1F6B2T4_9BACT|nr:MAG: ATP synthase F0 subunit C [Candidatus Gottesmanbacteria bacterium RIFCSPLOWO2_01_FULL_46_9]
MDEASIKLIMTGLTVAIGGGMPALAIGLLTAKALEAIGRNPEAAGEIRTSMILGVAFAEAIAIYALVAGLIIKFV